MRVAGTRGARLRPACSLAQALAAGFQQSPRFADRLESFGSPVRPGLRQSVLGFGYGLRADRLRLVVSGRRAQSFSRAVVGWALHHRMHQAI